MYMILFVYPVLEDPLGGEDPLGQIHFLEKNTLDVDDFVRVFSLRTSLRGEDPLGQIHYFGEKYP